MFPGQPGRGGPCGRIGIEVGVGVEVEAGVGIGICFSELKDQRAVNPLPISLLPDPFNTIHQQAPLLPLFFFTTFLQRSVTSIFRPQAILTSWKTITLQP